MELLSHILIATFGVALLVWLALGWREAVVVLIAVPVTLALTLLVYRLLGYTPQPDHPVRARSSRSGSWWTTPSWWWRTSPAILDSGGARPREAAVEGVDEVGNPTILATFAVIAAILPMAFVSGLMGPYMRPIPVGASMAMLFSLGVAFIVTPYVALRLVREHHPAKGAQPPLAGGARIRPLAAPAPRPAPASGCCSTARSLRCCCSRSASCWCAR